MRSTQKNKLNVVGPQVCKTVRAMPPKIIDQRERCPCCFTTTEHGNSESVLAVLPEEIKQGLFSEEKQKYFWLVHFSTL